MSQSRRTAFFVALPAFVALLAASEGASAGSDIAEFERDAAGWIAQARCHEAYCFDTYFAGIGSTGCLSGSTAPVVLQLASGTVTIGTTQGGVAYCPIQDASTGPDVSEVLLKTGATAVFEFDPPVTAFYIYYASLATGKVGTMKLYEGGVLRDTLVSAPSPSNSAATGHGFDAWQSAIDRIEITSNDTTDVVLGAFGGLAAGESSLGTTTINNYNGPGGLQTVQLDFACTFRHVVTAPRVSNIELGSAHGCIRDAIAFARNGDTIVVSPEVFHEAIDLQGKAITITSTDPNNPAIVEQTVIDAGLTDWSAVQVVNGEGAATQLVGLTIANGKGSLTGGERRGGGAYVLNSSPTFDRCRFLSNSAQQPGAAIGRGGGMYIGDNCQPTVENCTFITNTSSNGGAIFTRRGGWTLDGCGFYGNTATSRGAGVSLHVSSGAASTLTVDQCIFDGNESISQGGAIAAFNVDSVPGGSHVVLEVSDSTFTTNRAGSGSAGGAIWANGARLDAESCDFHANSASSGGAISLTGSDMLVANTVTNCQFRRNSATPGQSGGVVSVSSSGPGGMPATIHQCIFTGNTGVSVLGTGNESTTTVTSCAFSGNGPDASVHSHISPVTLKHSIIWDDVLPSTSTSFEGSVNISSCVVKVGGSPSNGVTYLDPRFIDPLGPDGLAGTGDENFRLQADSPCINAGSESYNSMNPRFDADGSPRHQGLIDLGAYEFTLDCNANAIPDYQEIALGQLSDCNQNLQSDECENELDGNCNGIFDMCDLINGTLHDTNANGVPDELEVGGPILGNQVWSTSNGSCIRVVTQSITVAQSLTIEPGVRVRMIPGTTWTVLNGASLVIGGTSESPVEFSSASANPKAGDWGGIRYVSGSSGSVAHANIRHVLGHGLRLESANVSVTDCEITDVAGIDRLRGTSTTPAQVGGEAYGIHVTGPVSPQFARNVIERVRGGKGGDGAFATGGNDGAPGAHATAWGGDGVAGGNATTNGSNGVGGARGGDAYGIFCGSQTNVSMVNNAIRSIVGGDGGIGGGGGMGGWGGDGGSGRQANTTIFPPVCTGGDGANGGHGTDGGNAGPGGNGADAYAVRVTSALGASVHQNLVAFIQGGGGGIGGAGGLGGNGGAAGDGGFGTDGFICGDGPGVGGDGGNGGDGGDGGNGGQGGNAHGVAIHAASAVIIEMALNTVAELQAGAAGAAGPSGPAGHGGVHGEGAWGVAAISGVPIPVPIFPTAGFDGDDGASGLPGVPGGAGGLIAIRAENQAIVTLANSVLASVSPASSTGVTAIGGASLTLNFTLLDGFQTPFGPGTSNQGLGIQLSDAGFVDADAGDFHLSQTSTAIDRGSNSLIPIGLSLDFDGVSRIFDGDADTIDEVDLGVYEWQTTPPPCPGDTNADGMVNGADLSVLLGQFGQSVTPGSGADFNGDGLVNGADLSVLLGRFGLAC